MDFLDFDNHDLYFDEPLGWEDQVLLQAAADAYPTEESENILVNLHYRLPDNLIIIVALYRFYYYQHRYQETLNIAEKALAIAAGKLGLRVDWPKLTEQDLGMGVFVSMGLIRFYMLGLKASAYVLMRMEQIEEAYARLKKITELDPSDQFGADFLLKMAEKRLHIEHARQHNVESMFGR